MSVSLWPWIIFSGGVVALLLLDLLLLRRQRLAVTTREALLSTLVWVGLSAGFGLWVTCHSGGAKGLEFFTGYVIEYTLSMDNIFVFVLIFASFQVDAAQQRRLLFWGVLGAMIMRGVMVGAGTALLARFVWITYVFGAYILYAGVAMLLPRKEKPLEEKFTVRAVRRFLPLSAEPNPAGFVTRENGQLKFTVLFLVLIVVELTDLVFALDSVPAVFGVTRDPFIVYTSNICAILGLRSLYFLLAGAMGRLHYLHLGLASVLVFIGAKMIGESFYPVPTGIALLIVAGILGLAIAASLLRPKIEERAHS